MNEPEDDILAEATLETVRSLSENAVNRPWDNVLNCLPYRPFEMKPLPSSHPEKFDERVE